MRIGYISYEHPLGIAGGGIGTYLGQVARLMAGRGHEVEVFTGCKNSSDSFQHDGYMLHRVGASSISEFRNSVVDVFSERHVAATFDLVEAAEYGAEALLVKKKFPQIPLVVKLHTPSYLTAQLNEEDISASAKMRFLLGGVFRGKLPKPFWIYRKEEDPEYEQYCLADGLCSPSQSLASLIKKEWPRNKEVVVLPNPFVPDISFLNIPAAEYTDGELVVGFFGRLEKRKGILELLEAIPKVLQQNPSVIFQFAGKPHPSPIAGMDMEEYLKKRLKQWEKNLRFLGAQAYDKIPGLLAQMHICVFPSLWENFPNVCLEAMAAGRAVIASNNGGMAEMITSEVDGLLIPPKDPSSVAAAILHLVNNPGLVSRFGAAARERVLDAYNEKTIGDAVSSFYQLMLQQNQKVAL